MARSCLGVKQGAAERYLRYVASDDQLGSPELQALVLDQHLAHAAHIIAPELVLGSGLCNLLVDEETATWHRW